MLFNPIQSRASLASPSSGLPFILLCGFLVTWALLISWLFGLLPVDQAALEAARVQARVIQAVSQGAADRGLFIDPESDRHRTGMIGEVLTGLTSTQGSLPAKRTAATPDAAALLVALLREADVGEGSLVAVNASGSFPGFALAAVSACGALGAEAVMVLSIGSSSWGANRPGYNLLDMFMAVVDAGVWPPGYPTALAALSPGGSDDRGLDLDPGVLEPALDRAAALGILVLRPQSLAEAVSSRRALFRAGGEPGRAGVAGGLEREPDVLLTIGGNYAATGADPALALRSGVIWPDESKGLDQSGNDGLGSAGNSGLVQEFLGAGLPVIQVLNIEDLSTRYSLPYDPVVVPEIGKAGVYRRGLGRSLGLGLSPGLDTDADSGAQLGIRLGLRLGTLALILLPAVGVVVAFARYRRRERRGGS